MLNNIDSTKKKRYGIVFVTALVIVAALFLGFFFTQDAPADYSEAPICSDITYSGQGTAENPYEVSNVYQLQCMGEEDPYAHYQLTNDINASDTENWNSGSGFKPITVLHSSLNGDGHTVRDLYINRPDGTDIGLISMSNANISNIGVTGTVIGDFRVGSIVGINGGQSTIENAYFDGEVRGYNAVGGLVGAYGRSSESPGYIHNSYMKGTVSGSQRVGGVAGVYGYGEITNSYVASSGDGNNNAHSLIGISTSETTMKNVYTDTTKDGLTTAEMQGDSAKENMKGFDFENTWKTVEGDYPQLYWE